ncbi:hypothetical protein Ancab_023347 [Ancistrocladus abbreviatus]
MAVEASHFSLFPSQLMPNREILANPIGNNVNMYSNHQIGIGGGLVPISGATMTTAAATTIHEALLPFYNSTIVSEAVLPTAKTATQPLMKDDSGLTYNQQQQHHLLLPRKRSRDSTLTVNNNVPLLSLPNTTTTTGSGGVCAAAPVQKDTNLCLSVAGSFSFLGEDLSLQVMQQQLELDRLISLHMEKVRMEIEDRRRKQSRRIFDAIQEAISKRLRDKEEEIEKIGKLNWALEEKVKSLCLENQIWRDLAHANEATANALRTNLEQLLAQTRDGQTSATGGAAVCLDEAGIAVDVESCCGSSGGNDDEAEEVDQQRCRKFARITDYGKYEEGNGKCENGEEGKIGNFHGNKRLCKKCGRGESSVLLLPCRHLCLCAGCGPAMNDCPLCNSVKTASVHVNLS